MRLSSFYDEKGDLVPDRLATLPEDIRGFKDTLGKYKTEADMMRGMFNMTKLVGSKQMQPLPADASDADKQARSDHMRIANGVPEKPEDYGIKRPDDIPEEAWAGDYVNGMVGILHQHNASPELVRALVDADIKEASSLRAQQEVTTAAHDKAQIDSLKEAWGGDFAKEADNASRVARTLGLDPANDPMFKSASVVKAFAKMMPHISEDSLVNGDTSGGSTGMTNTEKANDIINNPANPQHQAYWGPAGPSKEQAVAAVSSLYKAGSGEKIKPR